MASNPQTDTTQGSSEQWDNIWKDYSEDGNVMKKLFTRSRPATIYQFWQRAYFEDFIDLIGDNTNKAFLELGSGRGTTSMYLAAHGINDITLLDLSDTALHQAVMNFETEGLNTPKTVAKNAEATELPDDSYDFIYNIGVLEHFEDPQPILKETFRLLSPGGIVYMPIVPKMPFYKSLICRTLFNPITILKYVGKKLLRRKAKESSGMVRTENGIKEYTKFAKAVGLQDVKCIPYNPYWMVNQDDSIILRSCALPLYRMHYRLKKRLGFKPCLKTLNLASCCYLLTGTK